MQNQADLAEKIEQLKKDKNALVLAHYYEEGAIQDVADQIGDSLFLAQAGRNSNKPVVLMAGVVFMAESVKLLSPEKIVLVPDMKAGCSLVEHSPYDKYLAWRREHPKGIAVTYVNSSVRVKSISDVICTSSNAEKIIESIPRDRPILFGPDRNMGRYFAKKLEREMLLWPGACEVHVLFSARKLFELRAEHPTALVLAHPECLEEVLDQADVIGSTSRLLEIVETSPYEEFIVATEDGIFHEMKKRRPKARLIQAPAEGSCACNQCPYMKLNSLEKIARALESLSPRVEVASEVAERAQLPLERMLKITKGGSVEWPSAFDF